MGGVVGVVQYMHVYARCRALTGPCKRVVIEYDGSEELTRNSLTVTVKCQYHYQRGDP